MFNSNINSLKQSSLKVAQRFHSFFDDPNYDCPKTTVPRILPIEPLFQRRLFTKIAIQEHRNIFLQLNPLTQAGTIINCRGYLTRLANGCFLLKSKNVNYLFTMQQIRYIAG